MNPYHAELQKLIDEYAKAHPNGRLNAKDGHESTLSPEGARNLHTELCRRSGFTADEIIAEWNRRSPVDDQW